MTADDWKPSEAIEKAGDAAWRAAIGMGCSNRDAYLDALKAVRPIIIAEAKAGIEREEAKKWKDTYDLVIAELKAEIEAAERERIAKYFETKVIGVGGVSTLIRALKDSKP